MTVQPTGTDLKLSRNVERLELAATASITSEAQRRRAAGEDVIDLSAEEPGIDTPRIPAEAGAKAILQGKTRCGLDTGILDLRAAIARQLSLLSGGRPINADNIVVSAGARQALFNTCFTLFGPGNEVLIPTPSWASYPQVVQLARAKPVRVPGDVEWSLKVGVDQLERARTADTSGVLLCTPVNPTGAVYTRAELKAIVVWAQERGYWVVSDEIYRRIHYGSGPAPSVLDLPDELLERVVLVGGPGETYAMAGWRIGFTLARRSVVKSMTALQSHVTGGPSQPAQWAAAAAYSDERLEVEVTRMVERVREKRDLVVRFFRQRMPGIEFVEPLGTFYFFFRVDGFFGEHMPSAAVFCERLLADRGVALAPGDVFGDERWVRLSYTASERDLAMALERITDQATALAARPG